MSLLKMRLFESQSLDFSEVGMMTLTSPTRISQGKMAPGKDASLTLFCLGIGINSIYGPVTPRNLPWFHSPVSPWSLTFHLPSHGMLTWRVREHTPVWLLAWLVISGLILQRWQNTLRHICFKIFIIQCLSAFLI